MENGQFGEGRLCKSWEEKVYRLMFAFVRGSVRWDVADGW